MLLGYETGDTSLANMARVLMAVETQSAQTYRVVANSAHVSVATLSPKLAQTQKFQSVLNVSFFLVFSPCGPSGQV